MLANIENILPCEDCKGGGGWTIGDEWSVCLECCGTGFDADSVLETGIVEGWIEPPTDGVGTTNFLDALKARTYWLEQLEAEINLNCMVLSTTLGKAQLPLEERIQAMTALRRLQGIFYRGKAA
jgi:hypothetical protein